MENKKYLSTVEKIEKEYEEFKSDLLQKRNIDIYNAFYQIMFYENIYEFILNFEDEIGELLKNTTLAQLYKIYLSMETINLNEYDEVKEFLEMAAV